MPKNLYPRKASKKLIVLGITGGIAAYKSAELCRLLLGAGYTVQVVMTENAKRFITPLTLETLSGRAVYSDLFAAHDWEIEHIALADEMAALLIAPATAATISRLAQGLAEDLLSCVALATTKPVIICPAMNDNMYRHPATQKNLKILKNFGYHILAPEEGELACGKIGPGRLPGLDRIVQKVRQIVG